MDKKSIIYGVNEIPPPHLCFLFGLQHVLQSISSTITVPLVTCASICAGDLDLVKSEITSTFLFMCGVSTILQCLFGVRLAVLQGGCHKFLPAIAALMAIDIWKCPDMGPYTAANSTLDAGEIWKPRMREIQGGILVASVFQVLLGCTGLLGLLLQFVGPITIIPTISLVGLSLIGVALRFCQTHWGISAFTVALLLLFSQYLRHYNIPIPSWSRSKGCHTVRLPIFKLMPVILAVIVAWGFCGLLTAFGVGPEAVRTDSKDAVLHVSPWLFWPYPGQWGVPTVSAAGSMAMLSVTLTSIIESVGDYYACARVSEVAPPPAHAINRGITIEGISSLLSGAIGSGGATTSYSQNVGAIGLTRVASRSMMITAGMIFLAAGVIGKFGAFLVTMPDPVLGGVVLVSFGMVTSVGLSTLSYVDLNSPRNLTIIGVSMMVGLMVPRFMEAHPDAIRTGNDDLDRTMSVLLGTAMFVGGVISFTLDNTIPGTDEERGILKWRESKSSDERGEAPKSFEDPDDTPDHTGHDDFAPPDDIYDLPLITPYLRKVKCLSVCPILPTFTYGNARCGGCRCRKKEDNEVV